jgi:putative transcription factor
MDCTICGREVNILTRVEIEGTVVEVCDRCVKFGRVVEEPKVSYKPMTQPVTFKELKENDFVANYGELIRKYREMKGLTREEFAKRISEKESVVKRVEEEQMEPNEELTRRIESFLRIKLTQEITEEMKYKEEKKRPKLTVGDVVEVS